MSPGTKGSTKRFCVKQMNLIMLFALAGFLLVVLVVVLVRFYPAADPFSCFSCAFVQKVIKKYLLSFRQADKQTDIQTCIHNVHTHRQDLLTVVHSSVIVLASRLW